VEAEGAEFLLEGWEVVYGEFEFDLDGRHESSIQRQNLPRIATDTHGFKDQRRNKGKDKSKGNYRGPSLRSG
jgi:hypothetical protein